MEEKFYKRFKPNKNREVMMFKKIFLLVILLSLFSLPVMAIENDCIYYFYGQECDDCIALSSYFVELSNKYPELKIEQFEVYHDLENYNLLNDYLTTYEVEGKNSIPAVFISGSYFIGKDSIETFLEERIKDNEDSSCPSLKDEAIGVIGEGEKHNVLAILTFSAISKEGLKDIFQPGMAVLILFLLILFSLIERRDLIIEKSLIYIAGVYLAYCLFGLGGFSFLYNAGLFYFFTKFVGLLGIIFGLVGIKTFFGSWEFLIKSVPDDLQKYLKTIYHFLLSSVGVFLLGFIISLFTLASVSDKLVSLRGLFAGNFMRGAVLPLILYYNLILVFALIVLLGGFNYLFFRLEEEKGTSDKLAEAQKEHRLKLLFFFVKIVVLILGVVLLIV